MKRTESLLPVRFSYYENTEVSEAPLPLILIRFPVFNPYKGIRLIQ